MSYQGKYMMLANKNMIKVYISKYVDHTAIIELDTKSGKLKLEIPHNNYLVYQADANTPYSDDLVYSDVLNRRINLLGCYDTSILRKMVNGKALVKI